MSAHQDALDALVAEMDGVEAVEDLRGELAFVAEKDVAKPFIRRLRDDKALSFELLNFVTGLDNYLEEPRFEVVYHLRSLTHNVDVRINVPVGGEDPEVETVTDLYPAANWLEREVWDMFGVRFSGHPNLERIMMGDDFEGHPLRKDYPLLGNTPGTPGHVGKGGKK